MTRTLINNHIEDQVSKEPKARLVANKYKVIRNTIIYKYPHLKELGIDTVEAIVDDIIHLDRKWRTLTEGDDEENKKRLEQQWVVDNLIK